MSVFCFQVIFLSILSVSYGLMRSMQKPPLPIDSRNLTFVVSARNLPQQDVFGYDDPFVKVFKVDKVNPTQVLIGTTEVLEDTNNPDFNKVFRLLWVPGTKQQLVFYVRDQDDYARDDAVGTVTMDVDHYVGKWESVNLTLSDGGFLIVERTFPVKFKLSVRNVPKADGFGGASDPFIDCYWSYGYKGDQYHFGTTKVLDNTVDGDFNETIEFDNYIPGSDQWWTFKIYDYDPASKNDVLGEALVEVDPFVEKKTMKIDKFGTGKDLGALGVIYVSGGSKNMKSNKYDSKRK